MDKAIGYTRVSTEEQVKEGVTGVVQLSDGRSLALSGEVDLAERSWTGKGSVHGSWDGHLRGQEAPLLIAFRAVCARMPVCSAAKTGARYSCSWRRPMSPRRHVRSRVDGLKPCP